MTYLFVIDHFGSGGAQRQMVLLACALAERGKTVEFFVYYPQHNFYLDLLTQYDIKVHFVEKKSRFSIKPILALVKLIKQNNYQAILSFLNTPNFYAEIAKLITFSNTPLFVSERSCYLDDKSPSLMTKCRENFHRIANKVVCNSHYQKTQIQKRYSWLQESVITIINGVDTDKFSPKNMKKKPKHLLVVARIDQGKNALNLAKALDLFKQKHNWAPEITWVGREDQTPASQQYIKHVRQYITEHDLDESWHWAGECSNVSELMSQYTALIHPSFYEGFPNAVCEALASGLPVLISNVNDNPMLVNENRNGFLFEPDQPSSIAESLSAFFSLTKEEVEKCQENCRNFALSELSIEKYATEYIKLFQENLNESAIV